MKNVFLFVLFAATFAGCWSCSPYNYAENWLICEGATRPFVVPADVFYVKLHHFPSITKLKLMRWRFRSTPSTFTWIC